MAWSVTTIVTVIIVVVLIVITYLYFFTHHGRDPRLESYFTAIGVIALVVSLIGFYFSAAVQAKADMENQATIQTTLSQRYLVRIEREFAKNPLLHNMWLRLNPNNPVVRSLRPVPETEAIRVAEAHMGAWWYRVLDDVNAEVVDFPDGWDNPIFDGWRNILTRVLHDPMMLELWPSTRATVSPSSRLLVEAWQ